MGRVDRVLCRTVSEALWVLYSSPRPGENYDEATITSDIGHAITCSVLGLLFCDKSGANRNCTIPFAVDRPATDTLGSVA